MIDIDRRTATLFALLAPFAASAAAAQSELPHKMPELGKGTERDMTKVPWMGNEVIAMLIYPGMTVMLHYRTLFSLSQSVRFASIYSPDLPAAARCWSPKRKLLRQL